MHFVPAGNADFAKKMLVNAPVEFILIDDMNHFVPWSHPYLIHDAILKMIQTVQDKAIDYKRERRIKTDKSLKSTEKQL